MPRADAPWRGFIRKGRSHHCQCIVVSGVTAYKPWTISYKTQSFPKV